MTLTSRRKACRYPGPLFLFLSFSTDSGYGQTGKERLTYPVEIRYPEMERRVGRRSCEHPRAPVATVQDHVGELANTRPREWPR